jgi:hypothetical protein
MQAIESRRRRRRRAAAAAALGAAAAAVDTRGCLGQPQQPRRCQEHTVYQYRHRRFSLCRLDDTTICHLFRFTREELRQLVPLLYLDKICWTGQNHLTEETALCVFLCRLAYPARLEVTCDIIGCSPAWCSAVFNDVTVHLWTTFQSFLEWHLLLDYERMALYAEAISDLLESRDGHEPPGYVAGEESAVFWGFVNRTFLGFCRPTGYELMNISQV